MARLRVAMFVASAGVWLGLSAVAAAADRPPVIASQGDAFVSLHGSWNRAEPTGYKIVRVRMKDGKPVGGYDDFITGWFADGKVWGRPVGLLVMQDGSLLIVDDGGRRIWRVTR